MILARWRARRANQTLVDQIHGEIVAAARAPALFLGGVPDDLDGRFEMVALHAGLVLGRLAAFGDGGASLSQDLVDCLFQGFDDALREMAISDVGVAKRIKTMAEAFYGRNKVYGEALAAGDKEALAAALARNAFRDASGATSSEARRLAAHVFAVAEAFETLGLEAFSQGRFRYPLRYGDAA